MQRSLSGFLTIIFVYRNKVLTTWRANRTKPTVYHPPHPPMRMRWSVHKYRRMLYRYIQRHYQRRHKCLNQSLRRISFRTIWIPFNHSRWFKVSSIAKIIPRLLLTKLQSKPVFVTSTTEWLHQINNFLLPSMNLKLCAYFKQDLFISDFSIAAAQPPMCMHCQKPLITQVGYESTCSTHCAFVVCCLLGWEKSFVSSQLHDATFSKLSQSISWFSKSIVWCILTNITNSRLHYVYLQPCLLCPIYCMDSCRQPRMRCGHCGHPI